MLVGMDMKRQITLLGHSILSILSIFEVRGETVKNSLSCHFVSIDILGIYAGQHEKMFSENNIY